MNENDSYIVLKNVLVGFKGFTKDLLVPNAVTEIESNILCSDLGPPYEVDSIYVPSSVKVIKDHAFCGIPTKKITLNEGLEYIGSYAFDGTVDKVAIPSSVRDVSFNAFTNCSLKTVEIADVSGHVSYFKQKYGENVKTLIIRDLNDDVLNIVRQLKRQNVNIPHLVIRNRAVSNDFKRQIRDIYPNVISITDDTKPIPRNEQNSHLPKKFGSEWIVIGTILKGYKGSSHEIEIPEGIEEIEGSNCYDIYTLDDRDLQNVTLPTSLRKIGELAFSDNHLKNISLPPFLEEIGHHALYNNDIEELVIPQSVSKIGLCAFDENPIKKIELYDTYASTNDEQSIFNAFKNLNPLEEITVHNTIGEAIRLLMMFPQKSSIRRINIMENAITFEEQLKLEEMFPNLKEINFKRVYDKKTTEKSWLLPENLTEPLEEIMGRPRYSYFAESASEITEKDRIILSKYFIRSSLTLPANISELGTSSLRDLQLSGIVFQEGLTTISASALVGNDILLVTFPSTLRTIGESAFENNALTTLRLDHDIKIGKNAFKGNAIKTVQIKDTFQDIEGLKSSLDCTVENLYIDNHDGNIFDIIECFKGHPLKKIFFTGDKISFKEKIEIMQALGRPILISNKTAKLKVVEQKSEIENRNTEISDLISATQILIESIPTKYRVHFRGRIKSSLEKYQKSLDNYSEDIDIETTGLPRLAIQSSPEQIKNRLLSDIEEIKSTIETDRPLYDLQSKLYSYIFIISDTPIEPPISLDTIEEKLQYMSYVDSQNKKSTLKESLIAFIEKLQAEIDDIITKDLPEGISLDSIQRKLDKMIEDMFTKAYQLEKKNRLLKGEGDEDLACDIRATRNIIDSLDKLNSEWLKTKLNNIVETYIAKDEPLDEKMILAIRKDLHPLLEELNQVAKKTFDKKDILNTLQEFLKRLSNKPYQNQATNVLLMDLCSLFEEIMTLLESPYLDLYEKEQLIKKMRNIIETTILKINMGENIVSKEPAIEGTPISPSNLDILPESLQAIIKTSSQLYDIKLLIEGKIAKEIEVEKFKVSNL